MKKSFLRFFLLTLISGVFASSKAAESAVSIDVNGTLSGTLLMPANVQKKPAVLLLVAGSGPTDRDGNAPGARNDSLKQLAYELASLGIASLRYDKRGVGKSADRRISEKDLRFETFVDDAVAWVEFLKKDQRFSRLIIAGHSEGALIAAVAASKSPVNKVVSISGDSRPANELIREQLQGKLPEELLQESLSILDNLSARVKTSTVSPALSALFRPSVQPYLMSWFAYNPKTIYSNLKSPVLIIHGDTDIQVGVQHAKFLSDVSPRAKLVIVPKMNHVLKKVGADLQEQLSSYNDPTLRSAPEVARAIAEFVYAPDGLN